MQRSDWLLLTVAAAGGESVSPVQLQKTLFLLGREAGTGRVGRRYYKFRAYDYGPFDAIVYSDAEDLEQQGLLSIVHNGRYKAYRATPEGLEQADSLRSDPGISATVEFLDKLAEWVRSQTFDDLVRAVYKKYPDMKKRSIFRG